MTARVFVVGFMGCGKSTIGKLLAADLGFTFIDLDHEIELSQHTSISDLFTRYGEQKFREFEQKSLHTMRDKTKVVIACGGGTPCFFDNMPWMNEHGTTVFLNTSPEDLLLRLQSEQAHRPLIRDFDSSGLKQFIHQKLAERMPFYTQAKLQVLHREDKIQSVQWIKQSLLSLDI